MSKEIAGFFDSVNNAKKAHAKKKNSLFASANEEAMDTWMQKQQAIEAEKIARTDRQYPWFFCVSRFVEVAP